MEINRSNIFEIVNTLNLKPDKDYGQNFLIEPQVSQKIVDALNIKENDYLHASQIYEQINPKGVTTYISLANCYKTLKQYQKASYL